MSPILLFLTDCYCVTQPHKCLYTWILEVGHWIYKSQVMTTLFVYIFSHSTPKSPQTVFNSLWNSTWLKNEHLNILRNITFFEMGKLAQRVSFRF